MTIDADINCSDLEKAEDLLRALNEARVDKAVSWALFFSGNYSLHDSDSRRKSNRYLSRWIAGHTDRLAGFAVINPSLSNACDDLRRAYESGLCGLKMVPTGWYPYDDCAHRVYETA